MFVSKICYFVCELNDKRMYYEHMKKNSCEQKFNFFMNGKMDEREKYLDAGKTAAKALRYGASLVKVGASVLEVTEKIEEKILDWGGEFAFPPQISLNEIAAHYCAYFDDKTVFKKGDIVKIDVGVMNDGYIGDNATSVNLGNHEDLVNASRKALENALSIAKPSVRISDIGKKIQETITSKGFVPVKNLSGHGLSRYVFHDKPSIPNITTNSNTLLKKGQVIAIEPFASTGSGFVFESSPENIYSVIHKKPVRSSITKTILKEIDSFKDMPFTDRWLMKKYPEFKVKFAIKDLLQNKIIHAYPPLIDSSHGMVSQAEHTVIVDEDPIITTL